MPDPHLNEREFELINIVGAQLDANQRDLSKHMDISLGMTNLLIRRLVAKGYIRILQLNKKKTQYILTPKGFSEKTRKSLNYTLKTIRSIGLIRSQLHTVLKDLYGRGERIFWILGESDLAVLVEMALHDPGLAGVKVGRVKEIQQENSGTVLICREAAEIPESDQARCVDLIHELAKKQGELSPS